MKLAAQRGAGGLLIRAMETNNTDAGIQEHCAWAIQHMSMRGTSLDQPVLGSTLPHPVPAHMNAHPHPAHRR